MSFVSLSPFSFALLLTLALPAVIGCEDPKSCGPCNDEEGTEFCVACPTPDLCIASIENVETGEVLFSCEEAPGESCATDELVASCPDL
jgi:hypothetical protein